MGGVVQEVAKPVKKLGESIGVVSKPKPAAPALAPTPAPTAEIKPGGAPLDGDKMPTRPASEIKKEEAAATRRARRRGSRALLSEARLNPELGIQTLGQGGSL